MSPFALHGLEKLLYIKLLFSTRTIVQEITERVQEIHTSLEDLCGFLLCSGCGCLKYYLFLALAVHDVSVSELLSNVVRMFAFFLHLMGCLPRN